MDQVTQAKTELRLQSWSELITECQNSCMTVKAWCELHDVNVKSYYYWLRKIRSMAYQEMNVSLPVVSNSKDTVPASFAEFSGHDLLEPGSTAAVIIRTSRSTIEISSGVSERLMVKLVTGKDGDTCSLKLMEYPVL